MLLFDNILIVIRGGGDLGSGVAYRLYRAGFPVVITELAAPLLVRRTVAYGSAAIDGEITVDNVTARLVPDVASVSAVLMQDEMPVLVDEEGSAIRELAPVVVVDARMAKRNLGTTLRDAPLVIALGPGFEAGKDCHAVIETNRGHYLGRVFWQGHAEADTGTPGKVNGVAYDRVLRAPADGYVTPHRSIGDRVHKGDVIAEVVGQPVVAPLDGVLRGLVHSCVPVTAGLKIGDVDPRARRDHCFTISEKSLAVGGGALEAVLSSKVVRSLIRQRMTP